MPVKGQILISSDQTVAQETHMERKQETGERDKRGKEKKNDAHNVGGNRYDAGRGVEANPLSAV